MMNMQQPLKSFVQWQLVKSLGSGAFGEVYHWKNVYNGSEIATKLLKPNPNLKQDELHILHKRWLQEHKWMQNLQTNFIVGAIQINDADFLNYLAGYHGVDATTPLPVIIMEYCNGGDLRSHLNKTVNINGLQEYEVRNILFALLRATEYLHNQCNIEHRDIKPENIVLHIKGNEKLYKLTDFGYAREIPERTIAQSVVGTRNYVAPEVIDPGIYTKTVDYWSIGILAYEIICGVRPFIPHQTIFCRMKNVTCKPLNCIAIVQNIKNLSCESFNFHNKIIHSNHMNRNFLPEMEKWLHMALETNYKTRGCDKTNQLKFYSDMDNLLQKEIVTVFSLKTLKIYDYEIQAFPNLTSFHNQICLDNGLDITEIFFIFPPLHSKKCAEKPIDYFVPEWCDNTNPYNPPVMLFVAEYLIPKNCDIALEDNIKITETIEKCLCFNMEDDSVENLKWILTQFERDTHFILSERQKILECYLMGLKYFALEIEHFVSTYTHLETLIQELSQLNGCIRHCHVVLNEYRSAKKDETAKENETAQIFSAKCEQLERFVGLHLKVMHKEILQKCRQAALNTIFEQYAKNDIFELYKYRNFLSLDHSAADRLHHTQVVFEKCIQQFTKFVQNSVLVDIRSILLEQINKFGFLRQKVNEIRNIILSLNKEIENFTRSLMKNLISDNLVQSMNSLHFDGPVPEPTNCLPNNCASKDFEMDSQQLINECQTLCSAMEMSLDMS